MKADEVGELLVSGQSFRLNLDNVRSLIISDVSVHIFFEDKSRIALFTPNVKPFSVKAENPTRLPTV